MKGILVYKGWGHLYLIEDETSTEIWSLVEQTYATMQGMKATQTMGMHFYYLMLDPESDHVLDGHLLSRETPFSFTNTNAYLDGQLMRFNGRVVEVDITPFGMQFIADPDDDVQGLYYTESNFCAIPDDAIKPLCLGNGGKDTCIFMIAGGTGVMCAKFCPPTARVILDRARKGSMNAGRIGSCKCLGRKED